MPFHNGDRDSELATGPGQPSVARALAQIGWGLRSEAEWVTRRIDDDAPAIRRWLSRRHSRSEPLGFSHGSSTVLDGEIEVELLRDIAVRPGRGPSPATFSALSHTRCERTSTVVSFNGIASPPSIAAQKSARTTGSAQSNDTMPVRAKAIGRG